MDAQVLTNPVNPVCCKPEVMRHDWPFFKYVLRRVIFRHILAEHRRVEEIVRVVR